MSFHLGKKCICSLPLPPIGAWGSPHTSFTTVGASCASPCPGCSARGQPLPIQPQLPRPSSQPTAPTCPPTSCACPPTCQCHLEPIHPKTGLHNHLDIYVLQWLHFLTLTSCQPPRHGTSCCPGRRGEWRCVKSQPSFGPQAVGGTCRNFFFRG